MAAEGLAPASEGQVTAAEIAELAGVSRAAVSNWRRRFDDFPAPVAIAPGGGDLFRFADIDGWLRKHGRLAGQIAHEKTLWQTVDAMRGVMPIDSMIQVAAAFIGLLSVDGGGHRQQWRAAHGTDDLEAAVAAVAAATQTERPELDKLFSPLLHADKSISPLLWALMELAPEAEDPADVLEAVLDRRDRLRVYGSPEFESTAVLTDLLVRLAEPAGTVFDPAAGEGGFLLTAAQHTRDRRTNLRLVGQEINEQTQRIARLRCLVHRIPAEIHAGDSLVNDAVPDLRADVVLCEPPFGMRWRTPPDATDPRWFAGLPSEVGADLSWVQHVIHHLASGGRGYLTLPMGSLFRSGRDGSVRRELVRRGCVEAVVALPSGQIKGSPIPTCLWSVRRPDEESPGSVLLINAAGLGREGRVVLDESVMARVVETVKRFRRNPAGFEAEPGFAIAVYVLDLLAPAATLVPAHWITNAAPATEALASVTAAVEDLSVKRQAAAEAAQVPPFELALVDTRATVKVRDLVAAGALELIKGAPIPKYLVNSAAGAPVLRSPWSRHGEERNVDLSQLKGKPRLTQPGDVIVMTVGNVPRAFVDDVGGHLLPDFMQGLRITGPGFDPIALAGLLSAPANARFVVGATIPRLSLMDVELPRLTENETHALRDVYLALLYHEAVGEELNHSARILRDKLLDAVVAGHVALNTGHGAAATGRGEKLWGFRD